MNLESTDIFGRQTTLRNTHGKQHLQDPMSGIIGTLNQSSEERHVKLLIIKWKIEGVSACIKDVAFELQVAAFQTLRNALTLGGLSSPSSSTAIIFWRYCL